MNIFKRQFKLHTCGTQLSQTRDCSGLLQLRGRLGQGHVGAIVEWRGLGELDERRRTVSSNLKQNNIAYDPQLHFVSWFWSVCIENAIINLWLVDDGEIFFEVNFALTTYNTKLRIIWSQATTLNYCNTRIRFKQGLLQGGQLNVQNAAFSNKNRHNAKIITYLAKRKRNFTFSAKLSRIIIYGNKVRATWSI